MGKEGELNSNLVTVFGGEGKMGRLTSNLFQKLGYDVISVDPKNPDSPRAPDAVKKSRIVFFSVLPIEEIAKIIDETEDLFRVEHIVLDNASLKDPLKETYARLEKRGVSICSTHPLSKHDQPFYGQKVLILEVGANAKRAKEVAEKLYQSVGMVTIPLSFEDHDRVTTVLQLVPHLIMRSVGVALAKSGVNLKTLAEIAPANFQLFNLSLWRTLVQDSKISATLIANLLKNPEGEEFARNIQEAIEQVVTAKDQNMLEKVFEDSYFRLNQDNFGTLMNETTITVLERLANLQVKSITIEVKRDRPGLLREILLPFEEKGVNLTAIDSHKLEDGVKFEIGIDEKTCSPEILKKIIALLQKSGCSISQVSTQ